MYTLLVVDDEYLVRMGIKETVDWGKNGIEIIGEASDGNAGLEEAIRLKPDIVLTDVKMPVLGGLGLLTQIKKAALDCEVIILSGYEEFEYVREALHRGAFAYLVKPIDNTELLSTVKNACAKLEKDRDNAKYYDMLKGELSAVKKQFLRDVLSGLISSEVDIRDKIAFYELPVSLNNNVAVEIVIDEFAEKTARLTKGQKAAISADAAGIFNETLFAHAGEKGILIEISECELVAIVCAESEDGSAGRRICGLLKTACHKFEEKTGLTLSVGIGTISLFFSGLEKSLQNAKKAASRKTLHGLSNVIMFDDINNTGYKREIQEALRFISENYSKDITVEFVSRELYISSSYLMHLFRDELGKTFNECVTDYRIAAAKELLLLNRYKIYEISNMVGYKDVKYFGQIFKKYIGMTPSEYSKQLKFE